MTDLILELNVVKHTPPTPGPAAPTMEPKQPAIDTLRSSEQAFGLLSGLVNNYVLLAFQTGITEKVFLQTHDRGLRLRKFVLMESLNHCTEGWECNLGFQSLNFFLAIMVWGASWDPTGRYSTMEPSVSTFRGSLKLSEVGSTVKKG